MVTSEATAATRRTAAARREWPRSTSCSTWLRRAQVQPTIGELEELLARPRPALAVRHPVAAVDPAMLRAALLRRRRRTLGEGR